MGMNFDLLKKKLVNSKEWQVIKDSKDGNFCKAQKGAGKVASYSYEFLGKLQEKGDLEFRLDDAGDIVAFTFLKKFEEPEWED